MCRPKRASRKLVMSGKVARGGWAGAGPLVRRRTPGGVRNRPAGVTIAHASRGPCREMGDEPATGSRLEYPEHPASAYLEEILSAAYNREIDQQENVWRSLAFFAATLALELAAFVQLFIHLPPRGSIAHDVSLVLLVVGGILTLGVLWFMYQAVKPRKFRYISKAELLVGYVNGLVDTERRSEGSDTPFLALPSLKQELARQMAVATDYNQNLNARRELFRALAGELVVASLFIILILAAVSFAYYVRI